MTLAMDFGTCNTVLARWQPKARKIETIRIGAPTRTYGYHIPGIEKRHLSAVVPSLIHYGNEQNIFIGAHVENIGLANDRSTFRWMKLDLLKGRNRAKRINGMLITPRQAAEEFIKQVLNAAVRQGENDLVITIPVEAFDHYVDWLQAAALRCFHGQVRMLDEATACILGYGTRVRAGQIYLVFDFGGGTLDISVVKTTDPDNDQTYTCVVLGRAGEEIGGALVDELLLQELQQAQGLNIEALGELGIDLLHAAENAKIRLSGGEETVDVVQYDELHARKIVHTFTAAGLRHLLDSNHESFGHKSLYRLIAITLERAIEQAQERYGVKRTEIREVFMVGGSSLLLGVADLVGYLLPSCKVHCENPFEAIARGACRYSGGDINLTLVHDYCLRAWDQERKSYDLVPVVPKGTRYPTDGPVSVKYVNGACEGATWLGLVIIERSEMIRPEGVWEVVAGRLQRRQTDWHEEDALREINPANREFICADPPCTIGTRRFLAGFGVDVNRRLTVSLKDLDISGHSFVQLEDGQQLPLPVVELPVVKL